LKNFICLQIFASLFALNAMSFVGAEKQELSGYEIKASQQDSNLILTLVEKGGNQQACDLVVEKQEYFQDLQMLDIRIASSQFCPLDVVGARVAQVHWRLPIQLRNQAKINLRINGSVSAQVVISQMNVNVINGGVQ